MTNLQIMAFSLFFFCLSFIFMKSSLEKLLNENNKTILIYWVIFIISGLSFVITGLIFFYSILIKHISI